MLNYSRGLWHPVVKLDSFGGKRRLFNWCDAMSRRAQSSCYGMHSAKVAFPVVWLEVVHELKFLTKSLLESLSSRSMMTPYRVEDLITWANWHSILYISSPFRRAWSFSVRISIDGSQQGENIHWLCVEHGDCGVELNSSSPMPLLYSLSMLPMEDKLFQADGSEHHIEEINLLVIF